MFAEDLGSGHRRDRSKVNFVILKFCKEMINPRVIAEISISIVFLLNYLFFVIFYFFEGCYSNTKAKRR